MCDLHTTSKVYFDVLQYIFISHTHMALKMHYLRNNITPTLSFQGISCFYATFSVELIIAPGNVGSRHQWKPSAKFCQILLRQTKKRLNHGSIYGRQQCPEWPSFHYENFFLQLESMHIQPVWNDYMYGKTPFLTSRVVFSVRFHCISCVQGWFYRWIEWYFSYPHHYEAESVCYVRRLYFSEVWVLY